jgi:rod shape-determining protein MreC
MESSRDDFIIAIRSAFLNKGTKQRFSLLVLILFSIIFMFLGSLNIKSVNFLKTLLKDVAYMSSFIVSGPENFIRNNYLTINSHIKLYKDHKKDKEELKSLKLKNLSNQILTLENIKYKRS